MLRLLTTKTMKLTNAKEMRNSLNPTSSRTSTKDLLVVIVKIASDEALRVVKIASQTVRPSVSRHRAKDHTLPPTADAKGVVRRIIAHRKCEGDLHRIGASLHLTGANLHLTGANLHLTGVIRLLTSVILLLLTRVFLRQEITLPRRISAMKFRKRSGDRKDDKKKKDDERSVVSDTQNVKKRREEI